MKIYTVTFLINNYGSVLQAYALQTCLRELGAEPTIIVKTPKQQNSRLVSWARSWLAVLKPYKHYSLVQRIKRRLDNKKYAIKNKKLGDFINNNISVTRITDEQVFLSNIEKTDVFLAGSDQIWSIILNPLSEWYTLQWLRGKENLKYSYAASIGLSELTQEQMSIYEKGLSLLQTVSLRERQAVNLLTPLFPNRIRQDLDPTLLYDKVFWRKIEALRPVNEPYVFVYMLRPDENVILLAKRIAKEKGLKVFYTGLYADSFVDVETVCDAGLPEFLSYIDNADVVVVNSFHGTVFSVLFEKPFLSVKVASTSSRVESFLEMTGLMSQYVEETENPYSLTVDYSTAEIVLERERKKSRDYLKSICNSNK